MAISYFASLQDAEVVDVDFVHTAGHSVPMRLFVDSGFTGAEKVRSSARRDRGWYTFRRSVQGLKAQVAGFLDRGWVRCRVPSLAFEKRMLAVFSNVQPLFLPTGVDGMVGLTFLRHFARWQPNLGPEMAIRS